MTAQIIFLSDYRCRCRGRRPVVIAFDPFWMWRVWWAFWGGRL